MNRITVAITDNCFATLVDALSADVESAFVPILGTAHDESSDEWTLLVQSLVPVPDGSYLERDRDHLLISSSGFMPAFGLAERRSAGSGFIHSHQGADPTHSRLDDAVDGALSPVAQRRTSRPFYLSMVVAGTKDNPVFAGRVDVGGQRRLVDRVRVVGERLTILAATHPSLGRREITQFDRQIRVFGESGQLVLSDLRVAVVGAGGTGSVVCEQLSRLGVGEILLIDDDLISESNLTRVFGSTHDDVGKTKVEVIAAYANRLSAGTTVTPIMGRVTDRRVAELLRQCDVIFGCTDDQWGRSVLSRVAYWYLIPLIDMGVVITSAHGRLQEIIGRITYVAPGTACLMCRGRIQPEAIRAEALPSEERARLAAEGYVQGLGEADPSVVTYTSLMASLATSELLKRLFGFVTGSPASESLFRIDTGDLRHNVVNGRQGHFCVDPHSWARGDSDPFLGQLWK